MQFTLEKKSEQPKENNKIATTYSRMNPFYAKVLENRNLNGDASKKETRHIELSLKGSSFSYVPGDCLGIVPENDPELVATIINIINNHCRF